MGDFLNGVCTNIIHLNPKKQFNYYGGNYDAFVKTKKENEVNQMKKYYKQQDEIKHIKEFIASCGTYSNLVKQAKSRQKILDKMYADGLVEKVEEERGLPLHGPRLWPRLGLPCLFGRAQWRGEKHFAEA